MRSLHDVIEAQIRYWVMSEEIHKHELEVLMGAAFPSRCSDGLRVPVLEIPDPLADFQAELPRAVQRF